MTYAEIVTAIQDWVESTETSFAAQIPQFVRNAGKWIYDQLYLPSARKVDSTLTTVGNNPLLTLPADFLEVHELALVASNSHSFLERKELSFLREYWPNPTTTTATPKYYAAYSATQVSLAGTPSGSLSMTLDYFFRPASCVTDSSAWLLANFDHVLLKCAVYEAYVSLKGEKELLAQYDKDRREALSGLLLHGEVKARTDSFRSSESRRAA